MFGFLSVADKADICAYISSVGFILIQNLVSD